MQQWQPLRSIYTNDMILNEAINVQQVPAPTFEEAQRSDYLEARFNGLGFDTVERDALGNVYGWFGNKSCDTVILVSAHHDTVFPVETDLSVRTDGNHVFGPGLGDNSLGVAGLLLLARHVLPLIQPQQCAICLVSNVREEGLGNLDGIRAVTEHIGSDRIAAAIVLEGMALGRVYHGGIAVRRFKVSATAEGGHSWMSFGQPSAIHGLVQLAADITRLEVPQRPRTTFNIGQIEGGQSVNSIATEAHFLLDMRSANLEQLETLDNQVRELVAHYHTKERPLNIDIVGSRPAGSIPNGHVLVKLALQSLYEIGLAGILEHGSTDANMLLSYNVPTVVVGITYGGNAHRLDEYIDKAHLKQGMWQLTLLIGAIVQLIEDQRWQNFI